MSYKNPYASTPQTANADRVSRLIHGPCTDIFRDILRWRIPETDFQDNLSKHEPLVKRLRKHNDMSYPQHGPCIVKYEDLDISLLYSLLRNICGIHPHRKGWGHPPDSDDHSVSADIERIRLIRNRYYRHAAAHSLTDFQFLDIWEEIYNTIKELASKVPNPTYNYADVILQMKSMSMDPERDQRLEEQERRLLDKIERTKTEIMAVVKGKDACSNVQERQEEKRSGLVLTLEMKVPIPKYEKHHLNDLVGKICALRNCGGGTIEIKNTSYDGKKEGSLIDSLSKLVEPYLREMDDEFKQSSDIDKEYQIEEIGYGEAFVFKCTGANSIATVCSNSKVTWKSCILDCNKEHITNLLSCANSNPLRVQSFLHSCSLNENENVQVPESESVQYKGVTIDFQTSDAKRKKILDCIGDNVHTYGSAFTKNTKGGHLVIGVHESHKRRTFWTIKGLPLTICDPKNLHCEITQECDGCYFKSKCANIVKRKMLWMLKSDDEFKEASNDDIDRHYNIIFHEIMKKNYFLIEIWFLRFDGVVFYRKEGPESYKIRDGQVLQYSASQWLNSVMKEYTRFQRGSTIFCRREIDELVKQVSKEEEVIVMRSLKEVMNLIANLVKKEDHKIHEEELFDITDVFQNSISKIIVEMQKFLQIVDKMKCINQPPTEEAQEYGYIHVLYSFILCVRSDDKILNIMDSLKERLDVLFKECRRKRQQNRDAKKNREAKVLDCKIEIEERDKGLCEVRKFMEDIKQNLTTDTDVIMNLLRTYQESFEARIKKLKEQERSLSELKEDETRLNSLSSFLNSVNIINLKVHSHVILPYTKLNIGKADITSKCRNIQKVMSSYMQTIVEFTKNFPKKELEDILSNIKEMENFAKAFQGSCEWMMEKLDTAKKVLFAKTEEEKEDLLQELHI